MNYFFKKLTNFRGRHIVFSFIRLLPNKMERDVVIPLKLKFYKRFVDNIYRRRIKNEPAQLFDKMNSYNPNVKLTIK